MAEYDREQQVSRANRPKSAKHGYRRRKPAVTEEDDQGLVADISDMVITEPERHAPSRARPTSAKFRQRTRQSYTTTKYDQSGSDSDLILNDDSFSDEDDALCDLAPKLGRTRQSNNSLKAKHGRSRASAGNAYNDTTTLYNSDTSPRSLEEQSLAPSNRKHRHKSDELMANPIRTEDAANAVVERYKRRASTEFTPNTLLKENINSRTMDGRMADTRRSHPPMPRKLRPLFPRQNEGDVDGPLKSPSGVNEGNGLRRASFGEQEMKAHHRRKGSKKNKYKNLEHDDEFGESDISEFMRDQPQEGVHSSGSSRRGSDDVNRCESRRDLEGNDLPAHGRRRSASESESPLPGDEERDCSVRPKSRAGRRPHQVATRTKSLPLGALQRESTQHDIRLRSTNIT